MRRPALAVLTTLAVAVPTAPALAAGAGDPQYIDPCANGGCNTPTTPTTTTTTPPPTTSPSAPTSPSTSPSSPSTPTASAAPAATTSSSSGSSGQLPYTGADTTGVAALGAGLVLTGAALRRRLRRER